ncbi:hypothetical protein TELCIR_18480, partial [Teladorsagia circumcincta]
ASVEYNLRTPPSLANASEKQKLEAFEEFWNSGVPRFGDQHSEGWDSYVSVRESLEELKRSEILERELQADRSFMLEERIASSSDDAVMSWVELERELDVIESRPRRRLVANYSALRRWVEDDDATTSSNGAGESSKAEVQERKKMKKRELPFTRQQFINKLNDCLFKYIGTPLNMLENGRLQMLLKLLLLLVQ